MQVWSFCFHRTNATMAGLKRQSATAAYLLAALACLAGTQPASADGRTDWQGYSWQKIDIAKCRPSRVELVCPPYHEKWDWKRNQWVDIAISINLTAGTLHLTQQLADNDPSDDDDVCVTALVVDAAGLNIIAHHQNWHSVHGTAMQDDFTYRSGRLLNAAAIHIGSKQCRRGPHQDDARYAAVLARLQP